MIGARKLIKRWEVMGEPEEEVRLVPLVKSHLQCACATAGASVTQQAAECQTPLMKLHCDSSLCRTAQTALAARCAGPAAAGAAGARLRCGPAQGADQGAREGLQEAYARA